MIDRDSTYRNRVALSVALFAPVILWPAAISLRAPLGRLTCLREPFPCTIENIPEFDQVALHFNSGQADFYSLVAQWAAGGLALVTLALLWTLAQKRTVSSPRRTPDLLFLLSVVLWNGLTTELFRLVAQRPRPFVYSNPGFFGSNAANYTSFYSGHTSFIAALGVASIVLATARHAPRWLWLLICAWSIGLAAFTAVCRVLAGRHFPSDSLAALLGGSLVALITARLWARILPNSFSQPLEVQS